MTRHLKALGDTVSVSIPEGEDGLTERECPKCLKLFKVQFGTGLKGEGLKCHCPYCGTIEGHDHFFSQAQLDFAHSTIERKVTEAVRKDLKEMEFERDLGFMKLASS